MGPALILCFLLSTAASQNPVQEFTYANNFFAQSVYKQLSQTLYGNFLLSPFSAEAILALVYSGSRGVTGDELRKALHLPRNTNHIEMAMKILLTDFNSKCYYTLHVANKMYIRRGYMVRNEFSQTGNLIYETEIENIDFVQNPVQTARTINTWVERHTNNRIKNMVYPKDFYVSTKAVLINALYFKGNWSNPFPRGTTRRENFYKRPNEVVKVDTMHHYKETFRYSECFELRAQFLELPFIGEDASMVIVLPYAKDGLPYLENRLNRVLSTDLTNIREHLVHVALPRFRIETTIDFKAILQRLGVRRIFQESVADLSGIAGYPGDLFISNVAQKTFIDVNEGGVEAAAATSFQILKSGPDGRPREFIADHPFIFYIKVRDIIIFVGRVTNPSHPSLPEYSSFF